MAHGMRSERCLQTCSYLRSDNWKIGCSATIFVTDPAKPQSYRYLIFLETMPKNSSDIRDVVDG